MPLKRKSRGDLLEVFDDFVTKSNITYDKMLSLSQAMIYKEKELLNRIKDKNAGLISYQ